MKVQCDNGLCDRLAMIFSYLKKERLNGLKLDVCWIPNIKCNGHFLDLFEPIDDLVFSDDSNVDFHGWRPCEDFNPHNVFLYEDLNLLPRLKSWVNRLRSEMGSYVAVHVRRTDKVTYNGLEKLTLDSDFFDFIDKSGFESIFLATDNQDTQKLFKERYEKRLFWSSEIVPTESFRKTSLDVAAVDLFTCVFADKFLGTRMSGYSHFISQFRRYNETRIKFL